MTSKGVVRKMKKYIATFTNSEIETYVITFKAKNDIDAQNKIINELKTWKSKPYIEIYRLNKKYFKNEPMLNCPFTGFPVNIADVLNRKVG